MTKSGRDRVTATLLAAGLITVGACANSHKKQAEMAQRAEATSGQVVYGDSVTATVESVDRENRTVTLREPEGDIYTVAVGEGVALDRVEPDDKVNVAYQEALGFQLQPPGDKPRMDEEATAEKLPNGVQYGRKVTTTVEILAIAPKGEAATFRNQDGDVRTVEVDNPVNREKVANLRPGDNVEVTYTEKLAVQLDK
jgi:translation initiation factor IF-1